MSFFETPELNAWPPAQPGASDDLPSTRSLWADILGIGPVIKMLTDPAMQAQAQQMMASVIMGAAAIPRIEAKLDAILGPEHPLVRATPGAAALPSQYGAAGAGSAPASGGALNDGAGAPLRTDGGSLDLFGGSGGAAREPGRDEA